MIRSHPNPPLVGSPWASQAEEFGDWAWQVRHRIDDLDGLSSILNLTEAERAGFGACAPVFRFAVTPYYALLADREDARCPIRRQFVPQAEERIVSIGERSDPLGEERLEVAPNLVHRYPDRVLLLTTDRCPLYCRFCTRRRIVGRTERQATRALFAEALDYVAAHDEIREVILSGGDAMMLGDRVLDDLLGRIRAIEHIDIIRLATRMPVTCPMRVTRSLAEILARHGPIYVMTHFNHPKEHTELAARACGYLVDHGVVVYNQTVLLRGVNDDVDTIADLNRRLVAMRVTPYYLHQCDMAEGIEHFRTPLSKGLEIIDGLRGHTSGLMVPQFCVDVPGGLGKITMTPQWLVDKKGRVARFRTYTGELGEYWDPEEPSSPTEATEATSDPDRLGSLRR